MSLNTWKIAILGTSFVADPRISLRTFIYTNWSQTSVYSDTALARDYIHIDTKFANTSKYYGVIVEKMPATIVTQTLGKSRVRVTDNYRIQVFARGFNSIDKAYKMCNYLDDLIGANPTALRTDGIDELHLTEFTPINTQDDQANTGQAKHQLITRYVAGCTLIYDKYV